MACLVGETGFPSGGMQAGIECSTGETRRDLTMIGIEKRATTWNVQSKTEPRLRIDKRRQQRHEGIGKGKGGVRGSNT